MRTANAILFSLIAMLSISALVINCSDYSSSECSGGRQNDAGTCSPQPKPCDSCAGTCVGNVCIESGECADIRPLISDAKRPKKPPKPTEAPKPAPKPEKPEPYESNNPKSCQPGDDCTNPTCC